MKKLIPILLFLTVSSCVSRKPASNSCEGPAEQTRISSELQKLRADDQQDREWLTQLRPGEKPDQAALAAMARNDEIRLHRLRQLDTAQCFKTAGDNEAAYLIFQHGTKPEHYEKAFRYSREAEHLGLANMKSSIATAADRYLVSIGHQQLFGTQISAKEMGGCWCLEPTEKSVPTEMIDQYRGGPNKAYTGLNYVNRMNKGKNCSQPVCPKTLKPTPRGTLPGFW